MRVDVSHAAQILVAHCEIHLPQAPGWLNLAEELKLASLRLTLLLLLLLLVLLLVLVLMLLLVLMLKALLQFLVLVACSLLPAETQ